MIATLRFDLSQEEDRLLHAEAVRSKDAFYVLREMSGMLRSMDKYGRGGAEPETVKTIRDAFQAYINDNELSTTVDGEA